MKFDTLKKLAEEGFPQTGENRMADGGLRYHYSYYVPTLSELVDACGDIDLMECVEKEWIVGGTYNTGETEYPTVRVVTRGSKDENLRDVLSEHWTRVKKYGIYQTEKSS